MLCSIFICIFCLIFIRLSITVHLFYRLWISDIFICVFIAVSAIVISYAITDPISISGIICCYDYYRSWFSIFYYYYFVPYLMFNAIY